MCVTDELYRSGQWRPNRGGLSLSEVNRRWPEAMVKFDWQCTHIQNAHDLRFYASWHGNAEHLIAVGSGRRSRYDPVMGIWIRSVWGISSYPRRITPLPFPLDLV